MTPDTVKTIVEVLSVLVAIITLVLAILGFFHGRRVYLEQKNRELDELKRRNDDTARENTLRRFEKYQQMQQRYRTDASIQAVLRDLFPDFYENDDKPSKPATTNDKLYFMGFYEELEIMLRSDLLAPQVAYYTFGVDALDFWTKETERVPKPDWIEGPTWELFRSFVEGVRQFKHDFPDGPGRANCKF
jgi:hypothetical protein